MQITLFYRNSRLLDAFRFLGEGDTFEAESGGISIHANLLTGELIASGGFLMEFDLKCTVKNNGNEEETLPDKVTFDDVFPASMGRPILGVYHYPRNSGLRRRQSREPNYDEGPRITCVVTGAICDGVEAIKMEAHSSGSITIDEMREFIISIRTKTIAPTSNFEKEAIE